MNGKQLLLMLCMGISFGNVHAMLRPALGPVKRAVAQQAFARRALSSNNLGSSSCRYKEPGMFADVGKVLVAVGGVTTWYRTIEMKVEVEGSRRDNQQMAERLKSMEKRQDKLLEQNTKILAELALLRAEEGK